MFLLLLCGLWLGWAQIACGQATPLATAATTNPPAAGVKLPAHVVSTSRQITVFCEDHGLAAALAVFCDKVRARLRDKLLWKEPWRHPVHVIVRSESGPPGRVQAGIRSAAYHGSGGLRYQILCVVPPPLNQEEFTAELVRALCTEAANRSLSLSGGDDRLAVPPLWFTEGLTQTLLGELRPLERELVVRDLQTARGARLPDLLAMEQLPPEGIERALFRAKCKMLVRSLGLLPDGPRRLQRFLSALRPVQPWQSAFQQAYGDVFESLEAAANWWTDQLQQRAAPSPLHRLSAAETDRRLVRLITFEAVLRDPRTKRETVQTVSLAELRRYLDEPGTRDMLADRIRRLESLQLIAHPSYLPSIGSFLEAIHHVRLERFRRLPATLRRAEQQLAEARATSAEVTAALDRLELQHMNRELLFLYRDYFQTFEQIQAIEQSRANNIKAYLDRFQEEASGSPLPNALNQRLE